MLVWGTDTEGSRSESCGNTTQPNEARARSCVVSRSLEWGSKEESHHLTPATFIFSYNLLFFKQCVLCSIMRWMWYIVSK